MGGLGTGARGGEEDTLRQTSPRQVEMAALSRRLQQTSGNGRFGLFRPKT